MFNNINAFKVKLQRWKNKLKLRNPVNFPQLKGLDILSLAHSRIFSVKSSTTKRGQKRYQKFKITELEFLLFALSLEVDT
jgi:hypothetical protein